MAYPPAPPLVLTRRLSSFLHSSLESLREQNGKSSSLSPASATGGASSPSTTLQTALLVTPSGKLLAYDSPLPVRTLRTHCSVAASLWAIHAASAPSVSIALNQTPQPPTPTPQAQRPHQPHQPNQPPQHQQHQSYFQQQHHHQPPPSHTLQDDDSDGYQDGSAPVSIAASFNGGAVFVVRKLRCGLLFACSTPAPTHSTASRPSTATVDPASVVALPLLTATPVPAESAAAVPDPAAETTPTGSLSAAAAATAATPTQSSLLPHTTLPIISHPNADASNGFAGLNGAAAPTPTPIAVPCSKEPSPGSNTGDLVGSLVPGSAATAASYETAHTGGGRDSTTATGTSHDANTDTASVMTSGTAATVGGGGGGRRGRKRGSVAATLVVARRQVDELARLLDEKLGTLTVPEDNIGLNGFC